MESRSYAFTRQRPHEGDTGGDQQSDPKREAADHPNTRSLALSLAYSAGLQNDAHDACSHRDVGNSQAHENKYRVESI